MSINSSGRERYATEAFNLIATIDADTEAAGRAAAAGGLTMKEAASALHRLFNAMPKVSDITWRLPN